MLNPVLIYSLVWEYRERWRTPLPPDRIETEGFAYVEGVTQGPIEGRFRGTNSARQRSDGRFLTDVRGVILGSAGLVVSVDYDGVGCPYPSNDEPLEDRTKVTISARHQTDDPEWSRLNDSICVGVGENRFTPDGTRLALFDVYEIQWELLTDRPTERPVTPGPITIDGFPFDLDAMRHARQA